MRCFILSLFILASLLASCKSLKRDPKVMIAVFSQGSEMENPKTIFRRNLEGREVIFDVIPELTHKNIVAFHPFPSDDGTYGVALRLDFKGTNNLEMVTRLRQGEMLMSMVNGAVVDYVMIDNTISDGLFTIWRGLPEELIAVMDKQYPRINALKKAGESASNMIDMTPSTEHEKKEALKRVKKAKKEAEEAAERAAKGESENAFDPEPPVGAAIPLSEALNP